MRYISMAVGPDGTAVVSSVLDSVWFVADDKTTSAPLALEGIAPLRLPDLDGGGPLDRVAIREWSRSQIRPVSVFLEGDQLLVPFSRGVYQEAASSEVAFRASDGGWHWLRGAPVLLSASESGLVALMEPISASEQVVLGFCRRRTR